jgi:hypothetical protein
MLSPNLSSVLDDSEFPVAAFCEVAGAANAAEIGFVKVILM